MFKISDLFLVEGTKSLNSNSIDFQEKGFNFIGRTFDNNGIQGKIEKQKFEPNKAFTITATVIGNYKYVKYQLEPYYCSQNINKLTPKDIITKWNENIAQYFISNIQKYVSIYDGEHGGYKLEELKDHKIKLPLKNDLIYFDFMEEFISCLKKIRQDQINNYILKKYKIKNVNFDFSSFYDCDFKEFKIEDLFQKIKVKNLKYKASELPNKPDSYYNLPALTAGVQNQGLNNYVPKEEANVLKNVISISANGANTGATFYQSNEFTVLQDAYAIEWIGEYKDINKNQYLFLTNVISKAIFGNYEWTNKAGWERIKSAKISLPVKNNDIDFDFMDVFIQELKNIAIKKITNYTNNI